MSIWNDRMFYYLFIFFKKHCSAALWISGTVIFDWQSFTKKKKSKQKGKLFFYPTTCFYFEGSWLHAHLVVDVKVMCLRVNRGNMWHIRASSFRQIPSHCTKTLKCVREHMSCDYKKVLHPHFAPTVALCKLPLWHMLNIWDLRRKD